jgi:hypothetical protein
MSRHAPLAPSAAERWIACPGSHLAEAAAPPSAPSEFADFGTAAHVLFAKVLRFSLTARTMTTDPLIERPLDLALDAARQILGRDPFLVELRLPALPGLGMIWGTSDVVGFTPAGPVDRIIDLKFGENIAVEADTPQLGVYALLAARCFGAAESGITVWILQPRCAHPGGLAPPPLQLFRSRSSRGEAARGRHGGACPGCAAPCRRMVPVVRSGADMSGPPGHARRRSAGGV